MSSCHRAEIELASLLDDPADGAGTGGDRADGGLGEGGLSDLPLPADCVPNAFVVDDGPHDCVLTVACDAAWTIGSCSLSAGRSYCTCEIAPVGEAGEPGAFAPSDQAFEISGRSGLAACAVAAGLCAMADDDLAFGEESCETFEGETGPYGCEAKRFCGRGVEVPFAADAQATLVRRWAAGCWRDMAGEAFACICEHAGVSRSYDLSVDDAAFLCGTALDRCAGTDTPPDVPPDTPPDVPPDMPPDVPPDTPPDVPAGTCQQTEAVEDAAGCRVSELCGSSGVPDSTGTAEIRTQCWPQSDGTRCGCVVSGTAMFSFTVGPEPSSETCAAAALGCHANAVIVPHGTPSCITVPGSVSDNSCWTELACTVPATIDGFDVVASTRLGVACRRADADGQWFCVCASSDTTESFELGEAGMVPAEACSSALPRCPDLTPAPLGPRGEVIPPLVSLPEP